MSASKGSYEGQMTRVSTPELMYVLSPTEMRSIFAAMKAFGEVMMVIGSQGVNACRGEIANVCIVSIITGIFGYA